MRQGVFPGALIEGRWRVEGVAGRGASGEVYRAFDEVTGEHVAVKLLVRDELESFTRFVREAEILAAIDVPGIVGYVGVATEPPCLVMQWLEGETLRARLGRGAMEVDATLALARRLGGALAALHSLGIVHRDLKPANVLMTDEGATLIDFGIARRADEVALTQTGDALGTPAYMAPEQVRGAKVDARADVYALGAILYECLAGVALVDAPDVMAALAQILVSEAKTLARVANVPPWLVALVERMVSHDAGRRPLDAGAVLSALDAEDAGSGAAGLSREETSVVSIVRWGGVGEASDATVSLAARPVVVGIETLLAIATVHDGVLAENADGAWVVAFAKVGSAADRATRAVACAWQLHEATGAPTVVATGLGVVTPTAVLGRVVEQAKGLVGAAVTIDEATAALIATRERAAEDGPFVGRKSQLATLTTMLAEVVDEGVTRSVLVIGEAGAGKSRLVMQMLRAWSGPVWNARADATRSAVPLALFGEVVAAAKAAGATPDPVLEEVRAADPSALAPKREAALKRLVRAASERGLVIALDDLQWADRSSLQLIASLVREELPLMLVMTCRSEAAERIASDVGVGLELKLGPLSLAAASELVRALMPAADAVRVAAVASKGAGHPLFLEELARAARAGVEATPDTVRMMLQARLEDLHPMARRVLRAAAVFGRDFWVEGVAFVADIAVELVRQHLAVLAREDLTRPHEHSRYAATEVAFRHDLVHEAAAAMSTEGDRRRAHRLAAEWLSAREPSAATIAPHLAAGDRPHEAAKLWALAAEQAHFAGDLGGIERCVAEARACGVAEIDAASRARVEVAQAWATMVGGDLVNAALPAERGFALAVPGSDAWYLAAGIVGSTGPYGGHLEMTRVVAEGLAAQWPGVDAGPPDQRLVHASARVISGLIAAGARHLGAALVKRFFALEDVGEGATGTWILQARAFVDADRGDHAAAARGYLAASDRLIHAGELASAVAQRANAADELMKVGAWAEAEAALQMDRTTLPGKLALVLDEYVGLAIAHRGRVAEGCALIAHAFATWNVPFTRGQIHLRLVAPLLAAGEVDKALTYVEDAVTHLGPHRMHIASARAMRSRVRRALGDGDGAKVDAEAAWAALIAQGAVRRPTMVRLAFIEELIASGETARAEALTIDARDALVVASQQISDPVLAASYLTNVPEHAETLARAEAIEAARAATRALTEVGRAR